MKNHRQFSFPTIVFFALALFMISNLLAAKKSHAVFCQLFMGSALCSGNPGDNTFTLQACTNPINPMCDGTNDITVSDQLSTVDLIDVDTVTIEAGDGNDQINIDLARGALLVDHVILVGQSGANRLDIYGQFTQQELIEISPASFAGEISIITNLVNSAPIAFADMEAIGFRGRGGNDFLTLNGNPNNNSFSYKPGPTRDSGTFRVLDIEPKPEISYSDIGLNGQVLLDGMGGANSLSYEATEGVDILTLGTLSPDEATVAITTFLGPHVPLRPAFVQSMVFETLGGEDVINILGPFPPANVIVNGGTQSSVDTLFFFGGGNQIDVAPTLFSFQEMTGGIISYVGIEQIGFDMDQADLVFTGFFPNSELTYLPSAIHDGALEQVRQDQVYAFVDLGDLTLDTGGGNNISISVPAIAGSQVIGVEQVAGTPRLNIAGFQGAELIGFEILNVDAQAEDDTFNVSPLDDTTVVVDGGPHGIGDTFNYDGLGLNASVGSSSVTTVGKKPVSYFNMENVNIDNVIFSAPPPGGEVEFTNAVFRYFQDDEVAVITVNRDGAGVGEVSVDFATSDGTAIAGEDYEATSGTLNWANGETGPRTIKVPLINQNLQGGFKTVNLTLSNLITTGGAELGELATGTLMILGGDAPTTTDDSGDNGGNGGNGDNGGNGGNVVGGNGCSLGSATPHAATWMIFLWGLLVWLGLRIKR